MSCLRKIKFRHCDYCAAACCYNSQARQRNMRFFRFPKEPDRCLKWVESCRGVELPGKTAEALHRFYVLCADHFEDSQFEDANVKNKLIWNAMPTLFNIPYKRLSIAEEKVQSSPSATYSKEKDSNKDVDNNNLQSIVIDSTSVSKTSKTPTNTPTIGTAAAAKAESISTSTPTMGTMAASKAKSASASKPIPANGLAKGLIPGALTKQQLRFIEMRRTINTQRIQISRLKKRVAGSKARFSGNHTINDIVENASKYISGMSLDFFASQLRLASKKDQGRRWTEDDKFFALLLKCISLEAYRLCSKVFNMPGIRTLRRWLRNYKKEVPEFGARLKAYKQKLMLNSKGTIASGMDSLAECGDQSPTMEKHEMMRLDETNLQTVFAEAPIAEATSSPSSDVGMQTVMSILKAAAAPKKTLGPRQKSSPKKKSAKKAKGLGQDQQNVGLLAAVSTIVKPQSSKGLQMLQPLQFDPKVYELLGNPDHPEDGTTFAVQEVNSEGIVTLTPIINRGAQEIWKT